MIGRILFVGWLFVMALVCLGLAASQSSLGWLIGGIVLLIIAIVAARQFKREEDTEREGASGHFLLYAILFLIGATVILFLLDPHNR